MINSVHAETMTVPTSSTTPTNGGGFDYTSFIPLVLIFGVFYFLIIRPQQKKMQQQKQMLNSLKNRDKIMTVGGIIGFVTNARDEKEIEIEIANGVRIMISRSAVSEILNQSATKVSEVKQEAESGAINKKSKNIKASTNKANNNKEKADIKLVNDE